MWSLSTTLHISQLQSLLSFLTTFPHSHHFIVIISDAHTSQMLAHFYSTTYSYHLGKLWWLTYSSQPRAKHKTDTSIAKSRAAAKWGWNCSCFTWISVCHGQKCLTISVITNSYFVLFVFCTYLHAEKNILQLTYFCNTFHWEMNTCECYHFAFIININSK